MIRLEKITEDNYRECLNLKVSEGQADFVSTNTLSLAKAYVFYDRVTPFAIYNDDTMVGFIMLRREQKGYFIWQFMIDERYQSRGYGKLAMNQAMEWMKKDRNCHEIYLTYKEGNDRAEKLYASFGFQQWSRDEEYNEINMVLYPQ